MRQRKRCKNKECNKLFTPTRDFQKCCCYECDIKFLDDKDNLKSLINETKKRNVKEANKKRSEFKMSDKSLLREKVQKLANRYGRLREFSRGNNFCVSCGNTNCKFDGGHFLPTSTYPKIRYNTLQINPQCVKCNRYNGGSFKEYRVYMIKRFGIKYVEKLESTHRESANYSVVYLQKYLRIMGKRIKRYE